MGLLVIAFGGLLVIGRMAATESLPTASPSAEADALAQKMLDAVNKPAWDTTGVVAWTFKSAHDHIWDKERRMAQVSWKQYRVLINLDTRKGLVYKDGVLLESANSKKNRDIIQKAWEYWINDSFWLNATVKVFDDGATRSIATDAEGRTGLLVTFGTGGATPGDSYMWFMDEQGLPTEWKMWVSTLPIGGISFTWNQWLTLSTGAKVATCYDPGLIGLNLTHVKGSAHISDWYTAAEDPFMALIQAGI